MFRNNSVTNAKPETSSLSNRLGGIERIENSGRIFDARAAVGKLYDKLIALLGGSNPQIAICRFFQDGVHRIVNQIQEHLLQLVRIGRGRRQVLCSSGANEYCSYARS